MRLKLNEQEVVDGICVFVANQRNCRPEDVDVKEIDAKDNGDIIAKASAHGGHTHKYDNDEILEGIFQFLEEYHSFNREAMYGNVGFTKTEGFFAEIFVNER